MRVQDMHWYLRMNVDLSYIIYHYETVTWLNPNISCCVVEANGSSNMLVYLWKKKKWPKSRWIFTLHGLFRFNFSATLTSQPDHGVRGKRHWFGLWEMSTSGNKISFPNWEKNTTRYLPGNTTSLVTRKTRAKTTNSESHVLHQPA